MHIFSYTHRIAVLVDKITYPFEQDEEDSYRVPANFGQSVIDNNINTHLLRTVTEKLAKLSD